MILLAMSLRSAAAGVHGPAVGAVLPQIVPTEHLMRVNAINSTLGSAMMLLSPAVAAVLYATFGITGVLFVDVVTAALGVLLLALLRIPTLARSGERPGYTEDLREGLRYARQHPAVRWILISFAVVFFLVVPPSWLTPLMIVRTFGDEVWKLTANEVAFSIGMIIGGAVLATWGARRDRMALFTGATVVLGGLTVALGLSRNLWVFLGLMLLVGVVVPAFSTTSTTMLQETVEPELQGRIFGLLGIVMALAMPAGMAVFGPLADVVSIEALLIAGGLLSVVAGLIIRRGAPDFDPPVADSARDREPGQRPTLLNARGGPNGPRGCRCPGVAYWCDCCNPLRRPSSRSTAWSSPSGRHACWTRWTCSVAPGEVHGLLGPNGAGKTTTLRILLGLLRADAGQLRMLGGDPWADAVELHRRLAYVPGDVTLWPNLTGGEVIDMLGRMRGGLDQARRDHLIERFDLDPTKKGRTYSKGNRQKVALVAALASDVELLLLDEPTAGLDPLMDATFRDYIGEVRALGRTVLLSSHILSEVEALCDRVSIIRQGVVVETGSLAELRHLTRTAVVAEVQTVPAGLEYLPGVHDLVVAGSRVTASVESHGLAADDVRPGIRRRDQPDHAAADPGGAVPAPLPAVPARGGGGSWRGTGDAPRRRPRRAPARASGEAIGMTAGPASLPAPATGAPTDRSAGGGGRGGRSGTFTATGHVLRLALRRDRVMLPAWVLGISGMAYFSASATIGLYPELPQRVLAAGAVNGSAALVALYGRIYDPTSLGELSLFKMTAFGAAMVGVLMIMLVVRHTRADEEAGRLELVGAGVVGRAAPLAAALLVAAIGCTSLALLTAAGLAAAGLPATGGLAFGLAWGATGMLFAVVGGIVAQLSASARTANGLGLTVLAFAYVARAVGDLAEQGPGWLSWLSPIGWSQQVRAFSGTRWSILVLPLLATLLMLPVAFWLRSRRDLGAGLVADRPGPAQGALGSPWGLAWRLQRPALLAWAVIAALMGTVLGSVADSVSGFLDSPQMAQFLERLGGEQGLTDMFLAAELGIVGSLMAAYGVAAVRWLPAEEEGGRAENVLATASARSVWAASHVAYALLGVATLMILTGVAVGVGDALAVGDAGQVMRLALASTAHIPAAWVMVGLAVAIWGLWPRLSWLAWLLFVVFLVLGEFGALWNLPEWVMDLSPFGHSPIVPGPDPEYGGLPWLVVIAAALIAVGVGRFVRRDVLST